MYLVQNTGRDKHFSVAEFQALFSETQQFLDSHRFMLTESAHFVKGSLPEFITNIYSFMHFFFKFEIHHTIFLLGKMATHLRGKTKLLTVCAQ